MGRCDACHKMMDSQFHPRYCPSTSVGRRYRHDNAVRLLAEVLDETITDDQELSVVTEQPLGLEAEGRQIIGDIVLKRIDATGAVLSQVVLDIAVVDPTAPASLQQFKSAEKWDVTAKARERLKVKHFAEVYPAGIVNTRFCAMVFEASGRPGPSARDFIKHTMSEKW